MAKRPGAGTDAGPNAPQEPEAPDTPQDDVDQQEALDKLPEVSVDDEEAWAGAGYGKVEAADGAPMPAEPPEGHVRWVIPEYDRFHSRCAPGTVENHWGHRFVKMRNGDMLGDIPEHNAKVWEKAKPSRGKLLTDHKPKPAATDEELAEARKRAKAIIVE